MEKQQILVKFENKTLRTNLELGMDLSQVQSNRVIQLNALDEIEEDNTATHYINPTIEIQIAL